MGILLSIILLFLTIGLVIALALSVAQRWAIQDITEEIRAIQARYLDDDDELENW